MSKWSDRILKHKALTLNRALGELLDSIELRETTSSEEIDDLERIRQAQRYLDSTSRGWEPNLIPPGVLNQLAGPIQACINELNAYNSSRNPGHLGNANNQVDGILAITYQLPALGQPEEIENVREYVTSFRRSVGQLTSSVEREREKLSDELRGLRSRIEESASEQAAQKSRLDNVISEYQQQFSSAESERRSEFNQREQARITQARESLENHEADFRTAIDSATESFQTALEEGKKKLQDTLQSQTQAGTSHIETLEGYRDQAQELLQVIGSTGMAGDFKKAATSARHSVWLWQSLTVASMIGLIIFAVLAYKASDTETVDWGHIGTRIFVAISFGVLAAFSIRQADKYHESETRNRRYQLELSSIDPYLSGLPEETRNEVKVRLADKLFGNAGDSATKEQGQAAGTSLDVVKLALETVHDVLKKEG